MGGARRWVIGACALALLGGCRHQAPVYYDQFLAFGTLVELTLYGVDDALGTRASTEIRRQFVQMEHTWHAWKPGALATINQRLPSGRSFSVAPSMLPLLAKARQMSEQSGGLFEPAIGALVALWGFHSDALPRGPPPPASAIARLVSAHARMSDLHVDGYLLRSDNPAVQLDFGAIAKGYGVDQAVATLRRLGIANAIVNAGGDLRAIGRHGGRPWRIGIRHPRAPGMIAALEVSGDESVITSGDYERYYDFEGRRYHHIIDPRTGAPARGATSVTVIRRNGSTAEPTANALLVAGPDGWLKLAHRMGARYVMLVDTAGEVHLTPAMAARVRFETDPPPAILVQDPDDAR